VRLSDAEQRRLALLGARLGRRILTDVATIVRPDSGGAAIANSPRHRRYPKRRLGRPTVDAEIRRLVIRTAAMSVNAL
jgi:hypothetical protein